MGKNAETGRGTAPRPTPPIFGERSGFCKAFGEIISAVLGDKHALRAKAPPVGKAHEGPKFGKKSDGGGSGAS